MTRFRVILPALATLALVVAAVGIMSWATPAEAATIVVNTTDDENNADGDCSLREAVTSANNDAATDACTAGSGADIITLPAGTYTLTLGQIDINTDVTINGAGAAGIAIGLAASLGFTRALGSMLHGISATDPLTLGGTALLMGVVTVLACWIPARAATRVEVNQALLTE